MGGATVPISCSLAFRSPLGAGVGELKAVPWPSQQRLPCCWQRIGMRVGGQSPTVDNLPPSVDRRLTPAGCQPTSVTCQTWTVFAEGETKKTTPCDQHFPTGHVRKLPACITPGPLPSRCCSSQMWGSRVCCFSRVFQLQMRICLLYDTVGRCTVSRGDVIKFGATSQGKAQGCGVQVVELAG